MLKPHRIPEFRNSSPSSTRPASLPTAAAGSGWGGRFKGFGDRFPCLSPGCLKFLFPAPTSGGLSGTATPPCASPSLLGVSSGFFPIFFLFFYSLFLPFSPIRVLANGAGPRGLMPNATKAVPKFPSDSRLGNLLPNPPAFLLFSYLGNTHRERRLERESHGDKRALEFGLRE